MKCAEEMLLQFQQRGLSIDGIVLATGSATTHAGLLTGLRALGSKIPVYGFCVRRDQAAQAERVINKAKVVAEMIDCPGVVTEEDVWVDDRMLHPGYGQLNEDLLEAIRLPPMAKVCCSIPLIAATRCRVVPGVLQLSHSLFFS